MNLTVNARRIDDVVILDLTGRLTLGPPVLLLRETLRTHTDDGARKFVLHIADVSFVDNAGLGEFLTSYAAVKNRGGDVKLLKPSVRTADLLRLTRLVDHIKVFDEESAAVAAFAG